MLDNFLSSFYIDNKPSVLLIHLFPILIPPPPRLPPQMDEQPVDAGDASALHGSPLGHLLERSRRICRLSSLRLRRLPQHLG